MKTTAVLPVKRLDASYERLAGRLTPDQRKQLAEATLFDMLGKVRRCRTIDDTIIVTSDPVVVRHARWLDHTVLEQQEDSGHPQAAAAGARASIEGGADRVAMLPIDCPLFDPAELDDRLGVTPRSALIIPDKAGTGTNALVLSPPDAIEPAFGLESCARHIARARAAGLSFALEEIPSLARDLDTAEDMEALRDALLLAPERSQRTSQLLWDLGSDLGESPAAASGATA